MTTPIASKCRSCGEAIYWATTASGKSMPVNATPEPEGNVLLTLSRSTGKLSAEVVGAEQKIEPDRRRYLSHWTTCPNANAHRRKR